MLYAWGNLVPNEKWLLHARNILKYLKAAALKHSVRVLWTHLSRCIWLSELLCPLNSRNKTVPLNLDHLFIDLWQSPSVVPKDSKVSSMPLTTPHLISTYPRAHRWAQTGRTPGSQFWVGHSHFGWASLIHLLIMFTFLFFLFSPSLA